MKLTDNKCHISRSLLLKRSLISLPASIQNFSKAITFYLNLLQIYMVLKLQRISFILLCSKHLGIVAMVSKQLCGWVVKCVPAFCFVSFVFGLTGVACGISFSNQGSNLYLPCSGKRLSLSHWRAREALYPCFLLS